MFPFAQVDAIECDGYLAEILFSFQGMDILQGRLLGIIRSAHIKADIRYSTDKGRIRHHRDRCRIQHNQVISFLQFLDGIFQRGACHKLGRVRRDTSSGQEVEVGTDVRRDNQLIQVVRIRICQIVGDAKCMFFQSENFVHPCLAEVHPYKNDFLSQICQANGQIPGYKRFPFRRLRRGDHHYLSTRRKHEEQVGTQMPESFFHHMVAVFVHHDASTYTFPEIGFG